MENKNDRQSENIVEFIKNKNSLKRKFNEELEEKEEEKKEQKEEQKKIKQRAETSGKLHEIYSRQLEDFFKKNNFRENNGRVKIGGVTVNKKDLLYDLTHLAVKPGSFNLNSDQHEAVLNMLRKTGMSASIIRNTTLRNLYKNNETVRKSTSFFSNSDSSDSGGLNTSLFKYETKNDREIRRGQKS